MTHTGPATQGEGGKVLRAAVRLLALGVATPAFAAVPAGTGIVNTAAMTVDMGGQARTIPSNTVTLLSAELLDVAIVAERPTVSVLASDQVALPFLVTNGGNGAEDFALTLASDHASVAVTRVFVDTNQDGAYQAGTDLPLASGAVLSLAAGQQTRVFVLVDGAQVSAATTISATVTARTGSGAPGTVFAGAGTNGGDAVVGGTGASATAASVLTPVAGQPTLVKSQSVFAPDGSARPVRGAIVTYLLVATFVGATRGVAIDDPIPAGTAYVPGSLTLDRLALTDVGDGDAGTAGATAVHVGLGDVAAAGSHTIQFSVKIQ